MTDPDDRDRDPDAGDDGTAAESGPDGDAPDRSDGDAPDRSDGDAPDEPAVALPTDEELAAGSPESSSDRAARVLLLGLGALVAVVVGWVLFVDRPGDLAELLGVLLTVGLVLLVLRVTSGVARARFADYNVAEVAVEGPITRDGGGPGPLPTTPTGTPADDVVEQIEAAEDDDAVEALVVKLNTPGGQVVPSDDIRRAALDFDGPTVAYATDTCASGGYWIASGCDELWARDASVVGSVGVIGSSVNLHELAEDLGVSYERFAAGKYKDAGTPLKEMRDDEREYLQGIVDDFYEDFVERVAEGRDMDPEAVRDTEARVYLGSEAHELGLVDALGAREDVVARVAHLLDAPVGVRAFEPERGLAARLRRGAQSVAYAAGAGVAGTFVDGDEELRLRR